MSEEIKVEITSREIIKPSSPTSPDLKIFKLCLLDQFFSPTFYIPMLLFYSINDNTTAINRSQHLKSSLSKYLTLFYPLAGRIKDPTSIECSDEGVVYVEANVDCSISRLLKQPPQADVLFKPYLPTEDHDLEDSSAPFLLVQVNLFKCGGIAIGIRFSHKIVDGCTISTILNGWAALAFGSSSRKLPIPDLTTASSIIPAVDLPFSIPSAEKNFISADKLLTRRLVFDASKIDALKANAVSSSVPNPTRVEAVTAFIWKHVINASRTNSKQSVLHNLVNLRKRILQNSPENVIGNLAAPYLAKTTLGESEVELKNLVISLRKGLQEFTKTCLETYQRNDKTSAILELYKDLVELRTSETLAFSSSSLCRFPLYDVADFGWGKPAWIAFPSNALENFEILLDSREGDAIEVWLNLKDEVMALIEHDVEVLTYATFNPSII